MSCNYFKIIRFVFILYSVSTLFANELFSQNKNISKLIDSIDNQAEMAKSKVYESLVRSLVLENPNKAVELCNKWISKAKRLKNIKAEVDAITTLCKINVMLGDYDKADSVTRQAAAICEKHGLNNKLAAQYGNFGVVAEMKGQNAKAVEYYLTADSIFTVTNNLKNRAFVENNLGIVFSNMRIFDKSLYYYQNALKHKRELQDSLGIISTLVNIGVLHEKMKSDNDTILKYYMKAKKICDKYKMTKYTAVVYGNIGLIKTLKNEYIEASEYLQQALQMNIKLKNKFGMASAKLSLALLNVKQKLCFSSYW